MPTTYAIPNGRTVMDVSLWTGTGAAQTITNQYGFKPDLVWPKIRSGADGHFPIDTVRGIDKYLITNSTAAEATDAQEVTSINSNGFTLGTSTNANRSGYTFVGWQWQAGQGTTSSNTNGSITSTVSVNATAGFSIVTYTGTGSIATIGHGLGVAPAFMVIKARNAAQGWLVYHQSIGNTGFVYLNDTAAANYSINGWNNTSPTSTVFTTGVNGYTNQNGQTQVAYCWAQVAGFSAFGSYTGNGSADGPFIYTGFRPKFVMFKNASAGSTNWTIIDSSRSPYNGAYLWLYPNVSDAEANPNAPEDLLSNGFKIRTDGSYVNGSGNTIIYAAFAENPLKFANAR